jgi:hypothetical protein
MFTHEKQRLKFSYYFHYRSKTIINEYVKTANKPSTQDAEYDWNILSKTLKQAIYDFTTSTDDRKIQGVE